MLLYKDGNDVVGKTASGGDVVFRIAINSTSGAVTLTQYRAMVHGNPNDAESQQLRSASRRGSSQRFAPSPTAMATMMPRAPTLARR